MAEKGSLSTRQEKTKLNFPSSGGNGSKNSKNSKGTLKTAFKKYGLIGSICIVVVLAFGVLVGSMTSYLVSPNDCFEFIGEREVTLFVGQKYEDEGVKVVEYGMDLSNQVVKSGSFYEELTDGTSYEEGSFYIIYTVNTVKYGKIASVELTRIVTFISPSESDDFKPYIIVGDAEVNLAVGGVYEENLSVNKYVRNADEEIVLETENVSAEIVLKEVFERTSAEDVKLEGEDPLSQILDEGNQIIAGLGGKTFVLIYETTIDGENYEFTRYLTINGGE